MRKANNSIRKVQNTRDKVKNCMRKANNSIRKVKNTRDKVKNCLWRQITVLGR